MSASLIHTAKEATAITEAVRGLSAWRLPEHDLTPNQKRTAERFVDAMFRVDWVGAEAKDLRGFACLERLSLGLNTVQATIDATSFAEAARLKPKNRANYLLPFMHRWAVRNGFLIMPTLHKQSYNNFILFGNDTVDVYLSIPVGGSIVSLIGEDAIVERFELELRELLKNDSVLLLSTMTDIENGRAKWSEDVLQRRPLDKDRFAVFYPYLDRRDDLINEYLASPKSILFMYGPPGTGKSSLLRDLICVSGEDANLITNEALLDRPGFMTILSNIRKSELLIFEDADRLVVPRSQGNTHMAPLLSMTSGIAENPRKFGISTNLTDLRKVDTALYRLGRTFEVLKFRNLTCSEANAAREYLKLPTISFKEHPHEARLNKEGVSLATALNWEDDEELNNREVTPVGFGN